MYPHLANSGCSFRLCHISGERHVLKDQSRDFLNRYWVIQIKMNLNQKIGLDILSDIIHIHIKHENIDNIESHAGQTIIQ